MLTDLVVENLGVFETAALELEPGCSALTGETGAGKTLIVTAVSLLAGGRADQASIRPGADSARVEGRFQLSPSDPAAAILVRNGIVDAPAASDGELQELEVVISRSVSASASKARIKGRMVTVGVLSEVGRALVDVVGQHEHQRLFSPSWHRSCLDAFCGADAVALAREVAEVARSISRQRRALEELFTGDQERVRELDVLQYEIGEIESAALQQGERERLGVEATRLESSEARATAVGRAVDALSSEGGGEDRVEEARSALEQVADWDRSLAGLRDRMASALHELADVALELRAAAVEPDPEALERTHERLAIINRLCRKYGRDEGEVLAYLEACRVRADALADAPGRRAELEEALGRAMAEAELKAGRLSQIRRKGAAGLARATEEVLAELALAGARIEVRLQECDLYEGGAETVELLVDLNRTADPRPIKRVASGGELSRLALALHLVATSSGASTMVFDEVDAGVGGEAARALGGCLASLARSSGGQVLVVTHLPQVAAYADNHFAVHKDFQGSGGAQVVRVEGDQRVAELSRMLAGLPRSDRAHEHARELLELAAQAS
jgi:DNA repair protein RecN (Recombination protein N)